MTQVDLDRAILTRIDERTGNICEWISEHKADHKDHMNLHQVMSNAYDKKVSNNSVRIAWATGFGAAIVILIDIGFRVWHGLGK